MTEPLPDGLYESVLSHRLDELLSKQESTAEFEPLGDDASHVLSRHIGAAVQRHLSGGSAENRLVRANEVLAMLDDAASDVVVRLDSLQSIHAPDAPALARPQTPLADVTLLTNARGEPNMAGEIAKELASADQVDLLCAFIRFAGISVLDRQLTDLRERGIQPRVLTTTYRGATERKAIDTLVEKYGASVKIRYETASTRLHAKAWLFRRASGFDTGYVGSSNLSRSAMVDGLEWNVRISGISTPTLIRKFEATFDTYWNDPAFTDYDPATDAAKLDRALLEAGGEGSGRETLTLSGLEVMPFPHQERILEALEVERVVHDRHQNLVVAATGTGKTVVAALDFKSLLDGPPSSRSLLFVAHRREILEQSLRMYREVLGDPNFGDLLVDGKRPSQWRHVFASIQSLTPATLASISPDQFDVVVVDEFHHADAATYRRLLDHLQPNELLGLTATPERADGGDILRWFGDRIAYELRLWDALEQDLLCPFHYFGVADTTDLSSVTWSRGDYVPSALSAVFTASDARTRLILIALREKVADTSRMRALGFCVSVDHANHMAETFTNQGIASLAVTGATPRADRDAAFAKLREGTVQCLFAVDVFNEGLDIPSVDTLLLLRPTQSATIFLQQLGRGLRRSRGKAVVTVLDFIGHQRAEFRFDAKFLALTGSSPDRLAADVEQEFPYLPGGSRIVLDRAARETILGNLRTVLRKPSRAKLVENVRELQPSSLGDY
ncbi:DEAD/DEAH box helicase family protein [Williamsia sp.]|uniref:DEAD/DEAH box helicase family protein n=1 Tax=Williamsia sp. TaxID=1872085 RepID=UPI0025F917A1|nr:DEAD/DEAH box helicase family protein [Williamsia sp.]